MRCPYCNEQDTKVINSRATEDNSVIRRRRQCEVCNERFTTIERIERQEIILIKRDGTREVFERTKLLNGIIKSCNKRPVSVAKMEEIATNIENILVSSTSKEIETDYLGELVMTELKQVDEVAYVRFASVYKQFEDIETFKSELEQLIKEKN